MCVKSLSGVRFFVTPWTVAHQAPLSMVFSRQEYWSGLPCPPPGDLPDPGMGPRSPSLQANSLPSGPPGKPQRSYAVLCLVAQLCAILCDPMDCSPPGSSVHGILQARKLEWVTTSCSRGFSWPRDPIRVSWVSCLAGILYHWATWEAPTSFLTRDNLHTGPRWKIFLFLNYVK